MGGPGRNTWRGRRRPLQIGPDRPLASHGTASRLWARRAPCRPYLAQPSATPDFYPRHGRFARCLPFGFGMERCGQQLGVLSGVSGLESRQVVSTDDGVTLALAPQYDATATRSFGQGFVKVLWSGVAAHGGLPTAVASAQPLSRLRTAGVVSDRGPVKAEPLNAATPRSPTGYRSSGRPSTSPRSPAATNRTTSAGSSVMRIRSRSPGEMQPSASITSRHHCSRPSQ